MTKTSLQDKEIIKETLDDEPKSLSERRAQRGKPPYKNREEARKLGKTMLGKVKKKEGYIKRKTVKL
jgi:hypothetical protein